MANILAFDWDQREARIVVATTRGENARVRAALTIPLEPAPDFDDDEEAAEQAEKSEGSEKSERSEGDSGGARSEPVSPDRHVGAQLKGILKEHRAGRGPVLVGVDRGSVELVHLTLPPAGDEELAELVHNQIVRELHLSGEDGIVDFLPMSRDAEQPRDVTAAVLSSAQLERLNETCAGANVKATRFLLRAYAAASLFSRTASPPEDVCLLANRIGDEIDLTVLAKGEVIFSRTIRLPRGLDESVLIERLTAEIKRTIAVSMQNSHDAGPVEGVYLFGGPNEYQHLIETIQEELDVAAMVIDPFVAVDNAEQVPPQNAGEFAPLLGMILDEVRGGVHAIDFLNPRQRPKPPNRNRLYATIAAAVVAVIAAGGYYAWDQISAAKKENAAVYKEMRNIEKRLKAGQKKEQMVAAIREWQASDVCWLDELRDLSLRLPSSRDIVLHKMTLSPARGGGGSINYFGQIRDPSIVMKMEEAIRDDFHEIQSRRVQERGGAKDYTWRFETSMAAARRGPSLYTSHLPKAPKEAGEQVAEDGKPVAKSAEQGKTADTPKKKPVKTKAPGSQVAEENPAGNSKPGVKRASMAPGLGASGASTKKTKPRPKKTSSETGENAPKKKAASPEKKGRTPTAQGMAETPGGKKSEGAK